MKKQITLVKAGLVCLLAAFSINVSYGQVVSYTSATSGALNSVATHATGTALALVNGAATPGSSCSTGFSSSNYGSSTTYSSSDAAVQVTCTAASGYELNVTGFSVDLRRSSTGPADVRYAYSIDGGTTWTNQGSNQSPDNASCGTTTTGTWTTSFSVNAPTTLMFRVYGFDASSTAGTFQILNLTINGTVTAIPSCGVPSGLSATSITSSSATLNWGTVSGASSYNIEYRQNGASSWSNTTSATNSVGVSGLAASTAYQYQVQTVCSGTNSAYSSIGTFTTTAGSGGSGSSGKITIYFNQPVDTTVSTGVYAVYLNNCMADTIIAYINRAKYSIDIAQYEYSQTTGFSNIATAVNNAYARGVVVRWIYCAAGTNTGLSALNSGIHTLSSPAAGDISPCGKEYNIMHNKFITIDANSTNPNDALVVGGSADWNATMFQYDFNNLIILQDSALAHAYTNQFNLMWGSTTATPNSSASLWGPCKPNSGHHIFTIAGKEVELYFTPSDSTNAHILSTIATANTDLYVGMYTYTDNPDATQQVAEYASDGVSVDCIVDEYSVSYSAYTTLNAGLGASRLKVFNGGSHIYHNKYMIVDPSNTCSDPMVLTGSHNWTVSADAENDENTLIIHNDTIANIYYQAFKADFTGMGGTLSHIAVSGGCGTTYHRSSNPAEVSFTANSNDIVNVFPNPSKGDFTVQYNLDGTENVSITITNTLGQVVSTVVNNEAQGQGVHQCTFAPSTPGIYFARVTIGGDVHVLKVVKL